ncbi:uncharacterized protein LOC110046087 [Orbicella faveolata]|uniref:uncharacterized protein LOC110046087 n=1 Tax=Orbicella faveolata TaxID=48498 RepID=UPI0009E2B1F6|nr:uncharacterized protein LOC110046087 [Orbicella faveolata]
MTYYYLTVEMVNKAKTNGGFTDQKMFKTAGKYGFDSLFLNNTKMQVLDGYITHIRPFLKPTCAYVLVTRNGGQHNKLGELMSKLVFDATSKYVHPTRYRHIVKTVSCTYLGSSEQSTISEDRKRSAFDQGKVSLSKTKTNGPELEMEVRSRLKVSILLLPMETKR